MALIVAGPTDIPDVVKSERLDQPYLKTLWECPALCLTDLYRMTRYCKPLTSKTFRYRIESQKSADQSRRHGGGECLDRIRTAEQAIRERAYFMWKREGCPNGRAFDHWMSACVEERERPSELMDDEEKVLAGRLDANMPALLTKDVQGGDRLWASAEVMVRSVVILYSPPAKVRGTSCCWSSCFVTACGSPR